MGKSLFRIFASAILCSAGLVSCASAPAKDDLNTSIRTAEKVLADFDAGPSKGELRDGLKQAKAVLLASPSNVHGVALVRNDSGSEWSGPAFYLVQRLQAAGGATGGTGFTTAKHDREIVALAMSDKALSWFMSPQLLEKSNLNFVRAEQSSESERQAADLVLFTRPRAGESSGGGTGWSGSSGGNTRSGKFNGIIVAIDKAGNSGYYGHPTTPADILKKQNVTGSEAVSLQHAVEAAAK
jgi:hypothetical protein